MTKISQPVTISNCFSTKDLEKTLDMLDAAGVNFETCGSLAELQLKLAIAGKEFTQDVMSTVLVASCYCYDFPMRSNFIAEITDCDSTHPYVFNLKFFTVAYVLKEKFPIPPFFLASFTSWTYAHNKDISYGNCCLMENVVLAIAKKAPLLPFHFYDANKKFLNQHDMEFVVWLEKHAKELVRKDQKYKPLLDALESSLSAQRNISQFLQ